MNEIGSTATILTGSRGLENLATAEAQASTQTGDPRGTNDEALRKMSQG